MDSLLLDNLEWTEADLDQATQMAWDCLGAAGDMKLDYSSFVDFNMPSTVTSSPVFVPESALFSNALQSSPSFSTPSPPNMSGRLPSNTSLWEQQLSPEQLPPQQHSPESRSRASTCTSLSSPFLDDEVSALVDKCTLNPAYFVSSNSRLSDVSVHGVPALLQNVKKLQRNATLDRVRLRMHRYVLHVMYDHIKSALETDYAVKQYLSAIAPDEPFFPGRNDRAYAGKYARWVRDLGGPGVLFCNIKIDNRDYPRQGAPRDEFIQGHVTAGIMSTVRQLNPVAYQICDDMWLKAISWLNNHGGVQWRTTFPETQYLRGRVDSESSSSSSGTCTPHSLPHEFSFMPQFPGGPRTGSLSGPGIAPDDTTQLVDQALHDLGTLLPLSYTDNCTPWEDSVAQDLQLYELLDGVDGAMDWSSMIEDMGLANAGHMPSPHVFGGYDASAMNAFLSS